MRVNAADSAFENDPVVLVPTPKNIFFSGNQEAARIEKSEKIQPVFQFFEPIRHLVP
jgi:hypothetical protein